MNITESTIPIIRTELAGADGSASKTNYNSIAQVESSLTNSVRQSAVASFCSWVTDCFCPRNPGQEGEQTRLVQQVEISNERAAAQADSFPALSGLREQTTKGIFNPRFNCFVNSSLQAFKAVAEACGIGGVEGLPQLSHFLRSGVLTRSECKDLHLEMRDVLQGNRLHQDLADAIDSNGIASVQQDAGEFLKILLARTTVPKVYLQGMYEFRHEEFGSPSARPSPSAFGEPFLKLNIEGAAGNSAMTMAQLVDQNITTPVQAQRRIGQGDSEEATLKLSLSRVPDSLFVQIARYDSRGNKLQNSISGLGEGIQLPVVRPPGAFVEYEPIAFVCHLGTTLHGGHYITFKKENEVWKRYSDDHVEEFESLSQTDQRTIKNDSYLIAYKKKAA